MVAPRWGPSRIEGNKVRSLSLGMAWTCGRGMQLVVVHREVEGAGWRRSARAHWRPVDVAASIGAARVDRGTGGIVRAHVMGKWNLLEVVYLINYKVCSSWHASVTVLCNMSGIGSFAGLAAQEGLVRYS